VFFRLVKGLMLPIRGGAFLLRHRRLLPLAIAPFVLNTLLYAGAVFAFFHYYDNWFSFIMQRPEAWYWLGVYYVLRVLAFLMGVAVFVFSFVFVGTVLASPFLDLLSERTEAIVQDRTSDQPFSLPQLLRNVLRSAGHAFLIIGILALTFPVNFLPVIGHALWLGLGWLLLAYDMSSFAMDRRQLSFRKKWRLLLSNKAGAFGFGATTFCLTVIPFIGFAVLPAAVVAGTLLFLDIETQQASHSS